MSSYVVTYTERRVLVVEARDEASARRRAEAVLTGGVTQPAVEVAAIERVEEVVL